MSNSFGRKSEFIPATYTRYFERSQHRKSQEHTYFDDKEGNESNNFSSHYQEKRDNLFKRLFPNKYSESNDDKETATTNDRSVSLLNRKSTGAQSLGDFIPLPNDENRPRKRRHSSSSASSSSSSSSSFSDFSVSSSENRSLENQMPSVKHKSIVGHLHSRSTIEQVRSTLIRDLYQRTSDPHTEWLKCKMELPRDFINPKYYADFQRRYRHEIRRKSDKTKRKSSSKKEKKDRPSKSDSSMKKTIVLDNSSDTVETNEIIEIDSIEQTLNNSKKSKSKDSDSSHEFVVLDSDTDENSDENNQKKDSSQNSDDLFFIDRSSASNKPFNKPDRVTKDDYIDQDSKYSQLPSRNKSTENKVRPILSKHQKKKKNKIADDKNKTKSTPLVSAIDRIIDHMDNQGTPMNDPAYHKEQNEVIKTIKRRNKKKKKSVLEKSNQKT